MSDLPSSLPGIDVSSGLARVANNKKLYLKLLRHVARDSDFTREKLIEAISEGDAKKVQDIAHSLKGAAANLSITQVAATAEQLEMAARAGDFSTLFSCLDYLEDALTSFVAVVNSIKDE